MQEGKALDRIYLDKKAVGEQLDKIRKLAAERSIPVVYVPIEKLNSFNIEGHEGCIAIISKVQYYELQEVISHVVERGEVPLFLLLDGITDIRNRCRSTAINNHITSWHDLKPTHFYKWSRNNMLTDQ